MHIRWINIRGKGNDPAKRSPGISIEWLCIGSNRVRSTHPVWCCGLAYSFNVYLLETNISWMSIGTIRVSNCKLVPNGVLESEICAWALLLNACKYTQTGGFSSNCTVPDGKWFSLHLQAFIRESLFF